LADKQEELQWLKDDLVMAKAEFKTASEAFDKLNEEEAMRIEEEERKWELEAREE